MPWPKGKPRPPNAGRRKGTPNKASLPWKQLMQAFCEDPQNQEIVHKFLRERPEYFFKAAEFAFGKPNQSLDVTTKTGWLLPAGDDVAED